MIRWLPSLHTFAVCTHFGRCDGRFFSSKNWPLHAIWIALHGERTVFKMRQKHRRDADEVIDHLAFMKPAFG